MYLEKTVTYDGIGKYINFIEGFDHAIGKEVKKKARYLEIWHSSFTDRDGENFIEFVFLDSSFEKLLIKRLVGDMEIPEEDCTY